MGTPGAANEVATLKEAVSAAERNAAAEWAEREKKEAQAALLTSAALTAEVGALKQDLERSEQELGRAKKQFEDK